MAETGFKYDVFISYSHKDEEWVCNTLLPTLEDVGLKVCIDFRDFIAGKPALINMQDVSEISRHTILVLTPKWVKSEWTLFESILTRTSDPAGVQRRTIPLLLKKCKIPKFISMLSWVDFTNNNLETIAWQNLFNSLSEPATEIKAIRPSKSSLLSQEKIKVKPSVRFPKIYSADTPAAASSILTQQEYKEAFRISQTRYLDCLDSARFSSKTSYQNVRLLRLLYVKAQFVLAIISGDRIIATENQVLDSRGFLETFDKLLNVVKGSKLLDLPVYIALQESNINIQQSVAKNLRKIHDSRKSGYTLRLWEELNTDSVRRLNWADAIEMHKKPATADVHPSEREMLSKLWKTLEYFSADRCVPAINASAEFASRMEQIIRLRETALEQMKKQRFDKKLLISTQSVFTSNEECNAAKEMVRILKEIRRDIKKRYNEERIKTRSMLLDAIEQYNCNNEIKEGLTELVDGIYNQVLGIASSADIVQSSTFQEQKHSYIKAGYSLAAYVQETKRSPFKNMYVPWEFFAYDGLEKAERTDKKQLEEIVNNVPWIELLKLGGNPSWLKSLDEYKRILFSLQRIDEALATGDKRDSHRLQEEHDTKQADLSQAWSAHINATRKLVPSFYWNLTDSRIAFSLPTNSGSGKSPLPFFISYGHFRTKRDMVKDEMYAKWRTYLSIKGRMDAKFTYETDYAE